MPKKKKPLRRSNGEGTIRQRKDLRWEYRYNEYNPITGESKRKTFVTKDEEEFQDKVLEIKTNLRKGKATEACKTPLWEWIYEWLHLYKKKSLKPTTFDGYELTAQKHIKGSSIADIPIGKLQTEDLQRFYDLKLKDGDKKWAQCDACKFKIDDIELISKYRRQHVESRKCPDCGVKGKVVINQGIGIRTVHYLRTQIIGGALEKARLTHKIEFNQNEGTEIPELIYKETEPFSLEQIQSFLAAIETDNHGLAIKLDIGTGLRLGELISLQWPDFDFEKEIININRTVERVRRESAINNPDVIKIIESIKKDSKTVLVYMKPKTKKSESSVPIPEKLLVPLKAYKKVQDAHIMQFRKTYRDNKLVFCNDLGTQLDPKNFREHYQVLLNKFGLPENTFHALRHTFGALLLELGEDMKVIQELMRHDHLDTTADTYVKVSEKLKKRAASKMSSIL